MTPDEKFQERIDAIAMHLEITARMVEDNEKRAEEREAKTNATIDRILTIVESIAINVKDHEDRLRKIE